MVTLKKYLYDWQPELRRVMSIIFDGLVNSAVRSDESEYADLRAELKQIESTIDEDFTTERLLAAAGDAIHSLEEYNQRTTRFIRQQGAELRKMIGMLSESILRIGDSSERSQQALEGIQSNLKQARGLEDLQKLKARLGTCLEQLCVEALRQKEDSKTAIAELRQHIDHTEVPVPYLAEVDPVTGLPGRGAAEAALREAASQPGRKYIGILALDRLQSINARFGAGIGDQVLAELARHTQRSLTPGDGIYRWTGPALLTIMPRQCTIDRMRLDVKPVFSKCLDKEFDVGGRNVLIPVSPAWAVFGLAPPVATILKHIDTFVASQTPRDYV
jgi:GGDEF domain-containing protein